MIDFRQFLEAIDINTSDIDFKERGNELVYVFYLENLKYDVYFGRNSYPEPFVRDAYYVGFNGPHGYSLSGNCPNPQFVYSRVSSAVVKFVEEFDVKMLSFSGFEPGMDLVYIRMANRLNQMAPEGKQFIRITKDDWLRKDAYDKLNTQDRESTNAKIADWESMKDDYIQARRYIQQQKRQHRAKI